MTNPSAPAEVVQAVGYLRKLSTKQEGYGMAYHARGIAGRGEIHLYGDRAQAAHWLMENAERVIQALNTRPVASTLDPETASRRAIALCRTLAEPSLFGSDTARHVFLAGAQGEARKVIAEIDAALSPGKTGSAGVGEGTP